MSLNNRSLDKGIQAYLDVAVIPFYGFYNSGCTLFSDDEGEGLEFDTSTDYFTFSFFPQSTNSYKISVCAAADEGSKILDISVTNKLTAEVVYTRQLTFTTVPSVENTAAMKLEKDVPYYIVFKNTILALALAGIKVIRS